MAPSETDKATAKELQRIRRLPENRVCPNCLKEESLGFGAVCMTFKTFICHDCKSAHQSFSHRCKSVQMSVWTMDEVKSLDERHGGGNAAAQRQFLGRLTDKERVKQGSSPDAFKRFIERAYIKLKWVSEPSEVAPEPPSAAVEVPAEPAPETEKRKKSRRRRKEGASPKRASLQSEMEAYGGWAHQDSAFPGPVPAYAGLEAMVSQGETGAQCSSGSPFTQWSTPMASEAPPISSAASRSSWSTPTAKVYLPLDPTNPWAQDVLRLCEKHGQDVAGRFDLSPAMAGRSNPAPSWGETAY
mmetsp:Transcript_97682/g.232530  ORF Transcript_97682/g.232530 Transcript_97682/m.232530 type:complete len:300 (+) Transcript_97682:107-1006(+)